MRIVFKLCVHGEGAIRATEFCDVVGLFFFF
jgi:hypothetical protein